MKWLFGILSLVFLIIFHEFGHFIAAKICKVKVDSFSVGFGPIIFHKNIMGTDFRISLLPFGGYCGMKGEKDFQAALENKLNVIDAEPDSLYGIHPLKRAFVGFNGPFFNLIFAIFAYTFINFAGYTYSTYSNTIIIPNDSSFLEMPAYKSGLRSGDTILKINTKTTKDFYDILAEISTHPDETISIEVLRDNKILTFTLKTLLDKSTGTGKIGIAADKESLYITETEKLNIFNSAAKGCKDAFNSIKLTFKSISILFKGVDIQSAVAGPARITDLIGQTATESFKHGLKNGFISLFDLLAIISISLFLMNLLPIPVLDGGLILIAFLEALLKRKINIKMQYYIQFIGFFLILLIFFVGITGDILYFIQKR